MISSRTRTAIAAACAVGALLVLAAAPVAAKVIHQPEGSFNGSERPTYGTFAYMLPSDATNQSNGDVWVTEAKYNGFAGKADAVDRFKSNGEYDGVQITGEAAPEGTFTHPNGSGKGEFNFGLGAFAGIAVDNTTSGPRKGDLYVSDTGHHVVDRFSSTGAFECQITAKVPSTTEEIEHECNGAVGSQPTSGPGVEPGGLAVDSSGNIYVVDRAHTTIDIFGPSGAFKAQITDSHLGGFMLTIAVDSSGNLYVTNSSTNIVKFNSSGNFVEVLDENGEPRGVGVDPKNDHVYIPGYVENPATHNHEYGIAEYEPSPSGDVLLDNFAYPEGHFQAGIVVGPTGRVYAAEFIKFSGAMVDIYGPDIVIPNVTTQAATGVEETTATLQGHVDPDSVHGGSEVTSCQFEYGPTKAYGETAPCVPFGPYSGPEDVSDRIEGLRPQTVYHFRLKASNSNMFPSMGEDETFTTSGPPSVDHQAAEALTTSANFRARINPWGHDTTCQLQYVSDVSFQASKWADATTVPCSPEDLGSGFGDVTAKLRIAGLARATTYHYRFLATNQAGLSGYPDGTFETYGIHKLSIQFLKSSRITVNSGNEHWEAGEPEALRAGAHPYELVTTVTFSETTIFSHCVSSICPNLGEETEKANDTGLNTKDVKVGLPPGLLGNPSIMPKCNRYLVEIGECPANTQVGIIEVFGDYPLGGPSEIVPLLEEEETQSCVTYYCEPLYILEPSEKVPAEFAGFVEGQAPAWIPFHVRTGGDYGVNADSLNITSVGGGIRQVRVRVWGVPADRAHEVERSCPLGSHPPCSDTEPERPLITNPTSCTGPQTVTAMADTWQEPGQYVTTTIELPTFSGCDKLHFEPTLGVLPTTSVADSPSGLHVDLHVPQDLSREGFEEPKSLATADLKNTKVVLPPGLIANPASAGGLTACSPEQIELHGPEPARCPNAAKIGKVEVNSPLVSEEEHGRVKEEGGRPVPHPLKGAVYVATPYDNPFGSLLALYVSIDDPKTGIVVKLAGHVEANPETGQLTTTFDETPQLPFEDFKLDFFSGSRAVLRTAPTCGVYQTESLLTPWSAPESGPPTMWSSRFEITSAPGGAHCPAMASEEPDSPSFAAGTETPAAGSYSPFVLNLQREDDSQELKSINTVLPPGLSAKLAGVAECPDAAIAAAEHKTGRQEQESASCPAGSELGTISVGAGAGPTPYLTQGHIYFAGPYKGASFSLVVITPAVAGPYDLGTVLVRAALYIDPLTAQVTVKSDSFPSILQGILLDVRTIVVKINRPGFILNPTSCERMVLMGQALSVLGQSSTLSNSFQVEGCAKLSFTPTFKAHTYGRISRKQGASLRVSLTFPEGNLGKQANIHEVKVELPKQLPSRLETLKKACVSTVFDRNPGACPAGSRVGYAKAITPLLPVPLEGPAYFVSYGNTKFPELVIVLQGYGITIELHGETFINEKTGITSSTFHTVPDQPVKSFELDLPQGPDSALAAHTNLCGITRTVVLKRKIIVKRHGHKRRVTRTVHERIIGSLVMPTLFVAQNGVELQQNTPVSVTGCAKHQMKHGHKHHNRSHPRR